jgi:hypothetical protein
VDLDPDFGFLGVVLAEPFVEALGVLERADPVGVDFNGRHQQTSFSANAMPLIDRNVMRVFPSVDLSVIDIIGVPAGDSSSTRCHRLPAVETAAIASISIMASGV